MTRTSRATHLSASLLRLLLVILTAVLGLAFSLVLQASSDIRVNQVADSTPYSKGISALLVIGLFASIYGISRPEVPAKRPDRADCHHAGGGV